MFSITVIVVSNSSIRAFKESADGDSDSDGDSIDSFEIFSRGSRGFP